MSVEKQKQVAEQCRVVAHLARALAEVHDTRRKIFEAGGEPARDLAELVGMSTASIMETLGEILNGMDAADEEDEWTVPIFREAQRLWPSAQ